MDNTCKSFWILTFVSASKTIVTKVLFTSVHLPIMYSFMSCVVTSIALLPVFIKYPLQYVKDDHQKGLFCASLAIACDLAFSNVALAELDIALQQSIKALSPMITLICETVYARRYASPLIYLVILCASCGPLIIATERNIQKDLSMVGLVCMLFAVITGALKNVFAHDIIKESKQSMSVTSFTFWIELVCGVIIFPWTIATDEFSSMVQLDAYTKSMVTLVALYGGVRIMSQFYFLKYTSPTSLALSNICIQLLTSLSSNFFGTQWTSQFVTGFSVSILFSSMYAFLKLRKSRPSPKPATAANDLEIQPIHSSGEAE